LLKKAKFKDIKVNLSSQTIPFSDHQSFATFVKTVIMKPFLGHLPGVKKQEQFLDAFLNDFECSGWALSLDFVRLSISARKILT
jgi:hypothetical protein